MDLESTEQLSETGLILPIFFEYQKKVATGDLKKFEVQFSNHTNWFSKVGTVTSRLTQNLSRPLSVFAFFGDGNSKTPISKHRESIIKPRIASPTRMLRHMSLTGKETESGVDFPNMSTWNLGDLESNHRRTILDPTIWE
ncbi:hypothetical protein DSO57_1006240 [Entomophthora muscae]|uniref:Uncharacterized protein n=1 Tax=Entomophthora muscae TaxID=34485 RepID=A0ACC2TUL8_9FUNG|nr:hypothetical protein DSO57_1006240 [Entomophthora muscae]